MELDDDSKKRIELALAYNRSDARKAYTNQRRPNNRCNIIEKLRDGIELSTKEGRYKHVSTVLMQK